jgi:outer membrane lipoprotein carrier protein
MRLGILLAVFLVAYPGKSFSTAESPQVTQVLQALENRYGAARTLQAKFLERYTENGRFVRAESGMAYFLRPGKMRWDYEAPEKNTFLVDGKYVWFYSPADRTATRMPATQSEDWRTPLAFLTSHMKLSRLCAKVELDSSIAASQAGDMVFGCELAQSKPPEKSDAQAGVYKAVLFEASREGELRRIVVREEAGMELEFSFSNWEWNPPLDKSTFEFIPPRGVVIVNGLLPEAPGLRQ